MTIIAERLHGHWSAWVQGRCHVAFGGDTAATAVNRLVDAERIDPMVLACRYTRCTPERMELFVSAAPCAECQGSGRYRGLAEVADCLACCGSGRI